QPGADNAVLLRELAETVTPRPAAIEQARRDATPTLRLERGWMLLTADAYRPAYDDFAGALEENPTDARALEGLIRASAPLNRTADARALLSRLAADDPSRIATRLALSR